MDVSSLSSPVWGGGVCLKTEVKSYKCDFFFDRNSSFPAFSR